LQSAPQNARPWQLYRTSVELKRSESADQKHKVHQLRVETFHPGLEGDPKRSALVIGNRSDDGDFIPRLTVRSDGTVIVEDDVQVLGQRIVGPIPADLEDQRFLDLSVQSWAKGLTLASGAFKKIPLTLSQVEVIGGTNVIVGVCFTYRVHVFHSGATDGEVQIVTAIGELRDENNNLFQSETMDNIPAQPLKPEESATISKTTRLYTAGSVTLTVRVFALGAVKNVVEKTAQTALSVEYQDGPE
jgi:hypothetical protein